MNAKSVKKCNEMVYPRERYGSFKGHRCGRPAKFVCDIGENIETGNRVHGFRCGIHAKRHKILEAYKP